MNRSAGKACVPFRKIFFLASCAAVMLLSAAGLPGRAAAGSATVYVEGVPGAVVVNTYEVTAKVVEIDKVKRVARLQDEKGREIEAKAGPAAVNFDSVNVGDTVTFTLTEELVVSMDDQGAPAAEASSSVVAKAAKGEQPGGIISTSEQRVGTVTAIDAEKHTATLEFSDGSRQTLPVRKDVDLRQRKVGEKVVFRLTQSVAVDVEKK